MADSTSDPRPSIWGRPWRALRGRATVAVTIALCVVALLLALVLWRTFSVESEQFPPIDVEAAVAEVLASQPQAPAASVLVYQVILPSLVVVQTEKYDEMNAFGLGSGVVINRDANVLTALHVIEGSEEIELGFADGTRTSATVVNFDREKDIAVLAPAALPGLVLPATIGNAAALRVGDEVFAVGHPLGLVGSLSAGVVSGLERQSRPQEGEEPRQGLIQFDAAVNPGNSGGPLLDTAGRVVGIVTALFNPTDEDVFIGIGFAVPIDEAASVAEGPGQ